MLMIITVGINLFHLTGLNSRRATSHCRESGSTVRTWLAGIEEESFGSGDLDCLRYLSCVKVSNKPLIKRQAARYKLKTSLPGPVPASPSQPESPDLVDRVETAPLFHIVSPLRDSHMPKALTRKEQKDHMGRERGPEMKPSPP
ncbi:hypothetical protein RRG08_031393 [Elysia crispata]|uniref:Uncharacterized protein n=1 Tax=Elysia crispata TaxID=231223 RepID=A0AAE0ZMW7_9GAST|nr:hypothetical protein RRG08_031393 [Elysia crispata]